MEALRLIDAWPARRSAVAAVRSEGVIDVYGADTTIYSWASVTKVATALSCLVAVEEGTIDLDEAAGPPGATVRHLLAHASGLPLHPGRPRAAPGARRIYSNYGYRVLADHLAERAEMPFHDYFHAVIRPLGSSMRLHGDPGSGLEGTIYDLLVLARELLTPTLIAPATLAEAKSVQFAGLAGVLPGYGRQDPNDWGLGFELKDAKSPHWTGDRNSPLTFGHFGQSGTFLWVDPEADLALACLTDLEFDSLVTWPREHWPLLSDAVLVEAA